MALKDAIALGMSLPHRSPEPIDMRVVRQVAQRADALGFRDLWVTENTLDHVFSFDPMIVLTYAAAITTSPPLLQPVRRSSRPDVMPVPPGVKSVRVPRPHTSASVPPLRL